MFRRIHPRYQAGVSPSIVQRLGLTDNIAKIPLFVLTWLSSLAIFQACHKPFKISYLESENRRDIAKKILFRTNYVMPLAYMKTSPKIHIGPIGGGISIPINPERQMC